MGGDKFQDMGAVSLSPQVTGAEQANLQGPRAEPSSEIVQGLGLLGQHWVA